MKMRRPLRTPDQVCDNPTQHTLKSAHYGAYFNVVYISSLFLLVEVAVRSGIEHNVNPSPAPLPLQFVRISRRKGNTNMLKTSGVRQIFIKN